MKTVAQSGTRMKYLRLLYFSADGYTAEFRSHFVTPIVILSTTNERLVVFTAVDHIASPCTQLVPQQVPIRVFQISIRFQSLCATE